MRTLLIILAVSFSINYLSAQQSNYRTYSSVVKLSAFQGSENYQWENKDNVVFLDYKTGDFLVKLKNKDFYNTLNPEPADPDDEQEEREFVFKGIFPIRDIINQKITTQNYDVELQFICDDLRLNETVNFKMTITRPGTSQQNYRIFMLQGILYNDIVNLPYFEGFNNEIEIFINFNGYFEGNY